AVAAVAQPDDADVGEGDRLRVATDDDGAARRAAAHRDIDLTADRNRRVPSTVDGQGTAVSVEVTDDQRVAREQVDDDRVAVRGERRAARPAAADRDHLGGAVVGQRVRGVGRVRADRGVGGDVVAEVGQDRSDGVSGAV